MTIAVYLMRCKLFLAIKFHDLKFLICKTHSYFSLEKLLLFLSPAPTLFLCFQFFQKEFLFCCSLFSLFHFSPVSQFLRLFDTVQRYVMLCFLYFEISLAKWLSIRLQTKWFWVRVHLQSLKLHVTRLLRARSSLTFRQL